MFTIPHTLQNTVATMYKLMEEYIPDVEKIGWSSVEQVFRDVQAVPYRRDETAHECGGRCECLKRPGYTLILGGDCDDKAILAGAALLRMGIPVQVVTTSYNPDHVMEHTYIEFWNGRAWIPFDATFPDGQLGREYQYTAKQVWQ